MSNRKISFAKIIAEQEAKRTVRETDTPNSESSSKKETAETDKLAEQKVQTKRILAPKRKQLEQATPPVSM
ncbi:hypothetical protein ACTID9_22675 [Brevibacillus fluminis]|uniref:hypothetical protein n=1 Tax=Brevibacillus fluminis TaxID=511487 RepID=UPI003F88C859